MIVTEQQITVAQANKEHVDQIARLHAQYIASSSRGLQIASSKDFLCTYYGVLIEEPDCTLFVALSGDEVLGYCSLVADQRQALLKALIGSPQTIFYSLMRVSTWGHVIQYVWQKVSLELLGKKWPETDTEGYVGAYELRSVAVDSKWRGRALGTSLLRAALQYCTVESWQPVVAWVEEENVASNQLFLKSGFDLVSVRDDDGGRVNLYAWHGS